MTHTTKGRQVTDQVRESNLVELLRDLSSRPAAAPDLVEAAGALIATLKAPQAPRRFLTVLVRTQGNRIEPLKDALLCLEGQTCQDFDVVILVHSQDADAVAQVRSVVERLEPGFGERVRLDVVPAGARAVPLNVGLGDVTGRYVAVFDDDDLLFGHWVESFKNAELLNSGRMLRAVAANQWVKPEPWSGDIQGMRTTSWPAVEFPAHFDHPEHLLLNRSPFMTWAFPAELFERIGVRFDEELAVCEDWDVILQGASWCGVTEVPELTSIYRRWKRGDSSYLVHDRSEWEASEQRVRDRLDSRVLPLSPGSASTIAKALVEAAVLRRYAVMFRGDALRQPLALLFRAAQPAAHFAVRVRNKLRRMRGARTSTPPELSEESRVD